jgi:acetyltransferase
VDFTQAAQPKPLYTCFMGQRDVAEGADILQRGGVPQYGQPERMCEAFARAWRFGVIRRRLRSELVEAEAPAGSTAAGELPARARELLANPSGRRYLPLDQALELLTCYGLPVPPYALARTGAEAAAAAERIGFPVALKAVSEQVVHKSDVGAVRLGIGTGGEAAEGFRAVREAALQASGARVDGVLVQAMAPPGLELILGFKRDPAFGTAVLAGAGGIWVELLRDVSFRIPPFGEGEALAMLEELAVHPLLAGARGRPALDVGALAGCILRLARLALACPGIEELDVNPLLVYERGRGCAALDARVLRRRT